MNELVAIIFRIINFAVIIGASCYLFKRYVMPMIVSEIDQREKELNALHTKTVELIKQEKDAQQALIDQQLFYQKLNKKLEQWNTVFNASIIHRNRQKQQLIDVLTKKAKQQQDYIAMRHAQRKVLPAAIADARNALIKQFQQSDNAQPYLEKLIDHMRSGS